MKLEGWTNACFSLSDTPSLEAEHLVGIGDGTEVSGFLGLFLLVWNHHIKRKSQGKTIKLPVSSEALCQKKSLYPKSKG